MPNCNETRKENDSPKLNIDRICTPNFENALEKIDKNLKQPVKEPMQIYT